MVIDQSLFLKVLLGHLIFFILSLSLFLLPIDPGPTFLVIVVCYNLFLPVLSYHYKLPEILNIWIYSFLLSILQIIPDWILSSLIGVLVFPDDGLNQIGSVAGYMWGLWAIPFFLIIMTSNFFADLNGLNYGIISAIITSAIIFICSEMLLWRLGAWYAINVTTTFHVAHYIIIPEIFLGIAVFCGYRLSRSCSWTIKSCLIVATMLFYTGAAVCFYFFVEFV